MKLTQNQVTLARIHTDIALNRARHQSSMLSPQQRLLRALEEAIEDKRGVLGGLPAGSGHYLVTIDQINRWEEVRRVNR